MGGDGGVAVNDLGAHAAQSLNAQAQRGDIQQPVSYTHLDYIAALQSIAA